ncbi:MAG: glycosyltransferase family 4 protein [Alphaproteobacteria bacterium]|nr:glycosyltransferase family 4 protein [Alphaproteobacteria bacterium]
MNKFFRISLVIAILVLAYLTALMVLLPQGGFSGLLSQKTDIDWTDKSNKDAKNIIVDASGISPGGMVVLIENVVESILKKRPDWKFLVVIYNKKFLSQSFISNPAISVLEVQALRASSAESTCKMCDFITFGKFRNYLTQAFFWKKFFIDDYCDLIWDTCGEGGISWFDLPKVTTIHDVFNFDFREPKCGITSPSVKLRRMDMSLKTDKVFTTISNFTKNRLLFHYPNIPQDSIHVILTRLASRLDVAVSESESKKILDRYNLKEKNYLLFLSCFWRHKNHQNLIKAFNKFAQNDSANMKLALVGSGESKDVMKAIQALVDQLNLRDKVIFIRDADNVAASVLLQKSLAFIHPSLYEGFGMPLVEAMTAGVPVACSTEGSLPEIGGDAVLFFDPYNVDEITATIVRMVTDSSLRKSLIEAGKKQVKQFLDTDRMTDEYISVFEKVMKKR